MTTVAGGHEALRRGRAQPRVVIVPPRGAASRSPWPLVEGRGRDEQGFEHVDHVDSELVTAKQEVEVLLDGVGALAEHRGEHQ